MGLREAFTEVEWERLKELYPNVNLEREVQHCEDWWAEKKRPLKRPKSAFQNWLKKAVQNERQSGGYPQEGSDDESDGYSAPRIRRR